MLDKRIPTLAIKIPFKNDMSVKDPAWNDSNSITYRLKGSELMWCGHTREQKYGCVLNAEDPVTCGGGHNESVLLGLPFFRTHFIVFDYGHENLEGDGAKVSFGNITQDPSKCGGTEKMSSAKHMKEMETEHVVPRDHMHIAEQPMKKDFPNWAGTNEHDERLNPDWEKHLRGSRS